jgi:glycyl-tRNA synthetase beta chain
VVRSKGGAPTNQELLLELGVEELPSHFIAPALDGLKDAMARMLKEARLACGEIRTYGTPRRLVMVVTGLEPKQAAAVREAMGPSKAVAFDPQGQPTKAAIGFAASQGLDVKELEVRQTPKGEYLFAVKRDAGRSTSAVLSELLPTLIGTLPFPKTMKWNDSGLRFARPLRWMVALYGKTVVKCTVGGVTAGAVTYGHRFLGGTKKGGFAPLPVQDEASYRKALNTHGVTVDPAQRRELIDAQVALHAKALHGQAHRDEALIDQAVFSVECPHTIVGTFNPQYLALPTDIIVTAMKEHQGFFSVHNVDGSLLPNFLAVTNMRLSNMNLIRAGNERVLAARLADAKFYFEEDRKVSMAARAEQLHQVVFHQKLGTLEQKRDRTVHLAEILLNALSVDPDVAERCRRAAYLAKADLLSGVVGEFPALQGVMGGAYAAHDGEPVDVCRAIRDQYLPQGLEGPLPEELPGRILSLADRLDSVAGFFAVGMAPTGSEDPLALRRQALAVIRILVEGHLRLPLALVVRSAHELVLAQGFGLSKGGQQGKPGAGGGTAPDPVAFFAERLRYYAKTVHHVREDVMDAVLKSSAAQSLDVADVMTRMKAVHAFSSSPDFDPLMAGFKRANRIVEKEQWTTPTVLEDLFQLPAERELFTAMKSCEASVPESVLNGTYSEAMIQLGSLKPAIDAFFVGVMVNAEDQFLRANRLSLLYRVTQLFKSVADFSCILVANA